MLDLTTRTKAQSAAGDAAERAGLALLNDDRSGYRRAISDYEMALAVIDAMDELEIERIAGARDELAIYSESFTIELAQVAA